MKERARQSDDTSFVVLLWKGQTSFSNGDKKDAHRYWRQAAMLKPASEVVWLNLLKVVESNEDRLTCLNNVLAVNPDNETARHRRDALMNGTDIRNEPDIVIVRATIGHSILQLQPIAWVSLLIIAIVIVASLFVTFVL